MFLTYIVAFEHLLFPLNWITGSFADAFSWLTSSYKEAVTNPKARPADSIDLNPCMVVILSKVVFVTQLSEPCATVKGKKKSENTTPKPPPQS